MAVVDEDEAQLRVQLGLEGLALEDALEPVQQVERVPDGRDVLEGAIDELLHPLLEVRDAHVELDVVTVERVVGVVQEAVVLGAEVALDGRELLHERLHPLQLVLGQDRELVDRREHVDQLRETAAEEVELAEDLHLVERKPETRAGVR